MKKLNQLLFTILTNNLIIKCLPIERTDTMLKSTSIPPSIPQTPNPESQTPKSSYQRSFQKKVSTSFELPKTENKSIYLTTFSLFLGYSDAVAACLATTYILIDMFKVKSSKGTSKNYLLISLTGFQLLMFSDTYGFFGDSSYKNEIHVPDVIISFYKVLCQLACVVFTHIAPSDPVNKYKISTFVLCSNFIILWLGSWIALSNESCAKLCGSSKAFTGQVACIPQYVQIYTLKSTKGFSIKGQFYDILGNFAALLQLVVDYYNTSYQQGYGFWAELNYAKFMINIFNALSLSIFFLQHWYYEYFYKVKVDNDLNLDDDVILDSQPLLVSKISRNNRMTENEIDMILRSNSTSFGSINRHNSEVVLKSLSLKSL